jgi:hypothetical protein
MGPATGYLEVRFSIATTTERYLTRTMTSNIPSTALYVGAVVGHGASSATSVALDRNRYMRFQYLNVWWRRGAFANPNTGLFLPI